MAAPSSPPRYPGNCGLPNGPGQFQLTDLGASLCLCRSYMHRIWAFQQQSILFSSAGGRCSAPDPRERAGVQPPLVESPARLPVQMYCGGSRPTSSRYMAAGIVFILICAQKTHTTSVGHSRENEGRESGREFQQRLNVNPFTPRSDQCQIPPAALPEILHRAVWRTWVFIAYSDDSWLYYQFSLSRITLTSAKLFNCFSK